MASSNPPVVVFCTSVPSAGRAMKDTLKNVLDTREFVLNNVSDDFEGKMNECSATVPPDVDEFELSGLTPSAASWLNLTVQPKAACRWNVGWSR